MNKRGVWTFKLVSSSIRKPFQKFSHQTMATKARKPPAEARPSSSVILISPLNQILLLHRVKSSSSFASAHVFPGGNVSTFHDGQAPAVNDPKRHVDALPYRLAAIRETFEESGILLAKSKSTGQLLNIDEAEREKGRKAIHSNQTSFTEWLSQHEGVADTGGLIPFSRWITPARIPKRYTTQMYLYFLPLPTFQSHDPSLSHIGPLPRGASTLIPTPTHDGGVEHTAAQFLPSQTWLDQSSKSEIILFPPQHFLLTMVARFLTPTRQDAYTNVDLLKQRRQLEAFARAGSPTSWADVCISPTWMGSTADGKSILSLLNPGAELKDQGRSGISDYVVLVKWEESGVPRDVEVKLRRDAQNLVAHKL